jgi:hypothetical protein
MKKDVMQKLQNELYAIHNDIKNIAFSPDYREIILGNESLAEAHLKAFLEVGRFLRDVNIARSDAE